MCRKTLSHHHTRWQHAKTRRRKTFRGKKMKECRITSAFGNRIEPNSSSKKFQCWRQRVTHWEHLSERKRVKRVDDASKFFLLLQSFEERVCCLLRCEAHITSEKEEEETPTPPPSSSAYVNFFVICPYKSLNRRFDYSFFLSAFCFFLVLRVHSLPICYRVLIAFGWTMNKKFGRQTDL